MMNSKQLWKLHNWVGLYAGIVIAFLSLTGALAVFIPEVDRLQSQKYSIDPDLPHAADWENVYQNLLEKYPDFTFQGIEIPDPRTDLISFCSFITAKMDSRHSLLLSIPSMAKLWEKSKGTTPFQIS